MTKDLDRGRYTSEDATNMIGNRYDLILVATARARELKKQKHSRAGKEILIALSEIEDGKVGREYLNRYSKSYRKG